MTNLPSVLILTPLKGAAPHLDTVGGTVLLVRAVAHRAGLIFPPFPYGKRHPYLRPDNGFGPRGRRWQRWLRWLSGTLHNWLPAGSAHQGEIETEGFGLLAHDMGYECWGLPHLEVRHLDG